MDSYPAAGLIGFDRGLPFLAIASQGGTVLAVLLFLLLVLSFLIAGNEAALFSLQKKELDVLRTKQHPEARRVVALLSHPKELYVTLLMAGTFVNTCIILLFNYLLLQWISWNNTAPWLRSLLILLVIVAVIYFFTRLLPKLWATQHPIRFAHDFSFVAAGLHQLLQSPSRSLVRLAEKIGSTTGADRSDRQRLQELDEAIDVRPDEEVSPREKMIMKGMIKFGNIAVRQIMRSRLDVSGIEYNTPLSGVLTLVAELHYSRLPVYRGDLDQVVGILNTKDLLPYVQAGDTFDWHQLLRSPFFVPEPKPIEDLLKEFQQRRIHFAVVVDEFGGTSGIVTMEDILEEVIGDIRDEFDEEENSGQQIAENTYIFDGKTMLYDLCRMLQLPLDTFDSIKGDNDSLAGLLLELAGEMPVPQQIIVAGDFEFTVLQTAHNRIEQVQVVIRLAS
ncbi:MAG: gliding motility-associated protein GldE [Chitinophagia bacterium]|nr:gliding motility-associated protein GldE [Chitinophagia bacterium]